VAVAEDELRAVGADRHNAQQAQCATCQGRCLCVQQMAVFRHKVMRKANVAAMLRYTYVLQTIG